MRDTGEDSKLIVQAESKANAKAKAELKGMIVTELHFVKSNSQDLTSS